jgi:hypothetical protein
MSQYATRRSLWCSRESLRYCFACRLCPGSRDKRDRMVPSQKTIISIRTPDVRCLISTCKIPANLPYKPRCGSPRWPREPRRKTPESSSALSLRYSGARPVPLLVSAPYPPSDNVLGVKLCLAATEFCPCIPPRMVKKLMRLRAHSISGAPRAVHSTESTLCALGLG